MQRTTRTVYRTDYTDDTRNFDLLEISNGKAMICNPYVTLTANDLRQLSVAAAAAAEEVDAASSKAMGAAK